MAYWGQKPRSLVNNHSLRVEASKSYLLLMSLCCKLLWVSVTVLRKNPHLQLYLISIKEWLQAGLIRLMSCVDRIETRRQVLSGDLLRGHPAGQEEGEGLGRSRGCRGQSFGVRVLSDRIGWVPEYCRFFVSTLRRKFLDKKNTEQFPCFAFFLMNSSLLDGKVYMLNLFLACLDDLVWRAWSEWATLPECLLFFLHSLCSSPTISLMMATSFAGAYR